MKDLKILHLNKKILDPKNEIDDATWIEFVSITQDFFQKATLELGIGLLSEFLDHKENYFQSYSYVKHFYLYQNHVTRQVLLAQYTFQVLDQFLLIYLVD